MEIYIPDKEVILLINCYKLLKEDEIERLNNKGV